MEPNYVKIYCSIMNVNIDNIMYTLYNINKHARIDKHLSTITHIHKLHVEIIHSYLDFERLFSQMKNVTVNKLVILENPSDRIMINDKILKIIMYFKKVDNIILARKDLLPTEIPYPIKLLSKLCIYHRNQSNKNEYIEQFYKIPEADHIDIVVMKLCTNELLSTILSHPFERINITFGRYFEKNKTPKHIDMTHLTNLLIANPAKHIYIKNIGPNHDDLLRLIAKPNIISLRLNDTASPIIPNDLFEDNYTILRFYNKNKHNTQYLPTNIYERNIKYLEESRFKKTKAII